MWGWLAARFDRQFAHHGGSRTTWREWLRYPAAALSEQRVMGSEPGARTKRRNLSLDLVPARGKQEARKRGLFKVGVARRKTQSEVAIDPDVGVII